MSANPFNLLSGLSKSPTDQRSTPSAPAASQAQPQPQASSSQPPQGQAHQQVQQQGKPGKKRKNHRGGKKKRQRRKSFAIIDDDENHSQAGIGGSGQPLYQIPSANLSGASIDSEALLDHRCVNFHYGPIARSSTDKLQRSSADANAPILNRWSWPRLTCLSVRSNSQRCRSASILT